MFVSKYEVYAQYHPAEGGIYLHGLSLEDSEEFATDDAVYAMLEEMFYKELEYYDIPKSSVERTEKDWGYKLSVGNEEVSIVFVCDHKKPLTDNLHYDEDYGDCEDYWSWVEVEENSPYEDCFCYKYVPETVKGIHARVPYYC